MTDYLGKVRARPGVLDPGTSWGGAAKQTRAHVDLVKSQLVSLIAAHGPCTDEKLVDLYEAHQFMHPHLPRVSDSSIRTRRHAAVVQGLVVDSGERGITRLGNPAVKWAIADA